MYREALKDLIDMSVCTGSRVDYVQAGGGNTSVKFEDGYMAIKASGYLLKQMNENTGFVVVNGLEMRKYHEMDHGSLTDCNKEAMELALASIRQINGEMAARPSVEVGFHSILGKFVLHLHPVYANVLMCSKGGTEKAVRIAKAAGISSVAIEYTMPGYALTKLISDAIVEYEKANSAVPQALFLKNHGVVTHGDTAEEAMKNMDKINNAFIKELKLPAFPRTSIENAGTGYKSSNVWMKRILSEGNIAVQLRNSPVYPDQLVYTANELSIGGGSSKIVVVDGEIYYNSGEKEAIALEETMTALVYLYYCIQELGLDLELLSEADCTNILGWDSEKYRKSLMAGQ